MLQKGSRVKSAPFSCPEFTGRWPDREVSGGDICREYREVSCYNNQQ